MHAGRSVAGLILAAGAGRRYGGPKALTFLGPAIEMMRDAGCLPVIVVLGAAADEVLKRVDVTGSLSSQPDAAQVVAVVNPDWATGMASSLRVGLHAAAETGAAAACIHLVDMPGVTAAAVRRLIGTSPGMATTAVLARASYGGEPGHPVLLGRDHWSAIARSASGDQGARGYLREHAADVTGVECGDLAQGFDVDVRDSPGAPTTGSPDGRTG